MSNMSTMSPVERDIYQALMDHTFERAAALREHHRRQHEEEVRRRQIDTEAISQALNEQLTRLHINTQDWQFIRGSATEATPIEKDPIEKDPIWSDLI